MKLELKMQNRESADFSGYRAVISSVASVASDDEGAKVDKRDLAFDAEGKALIQKAGLYGKVNVTVIDPTGRPTSGFTTTLDELATGTTIEVPELERLNLADIRPTLKRFGKSRVTVVDDRSGQPLVGVGVELSYRSPGGTSWSAAGHATTDAAGNATFLHLQPDAQSARAIVAGSEYAAVPVDDGKLPAHAIVRVQAPANIENCACDAEPPRTPDQDDLVSSNAAYAVDLAPGGCVDFRLRPDRSLFEMRYTAVVRTTQPEIVELPSLTDRRRGQPTNEPSTVRPHSTVAGANINVITHFDGSAAGRLAELLSTDVDTFLDEWSRRPEVTVRNEVEWEGANLAAQARTVAHGHVVTYRQSWHSDGYSLGNLLYSLPLAPCQKKRIAILDWDREDTGRRFESTTVYESLEADIDRRRSVIEDMASGFGEVIDGGSSSNNWSVSASGGLLGGPGFLGVSAGYAGADHDAWQDSSRNLSANFANTLRDRTMQAQSVMRGQRSTVVKSVSQNEHVTAQTEVVANHNHCHAMTVQYFQVLRHFVVRTRVDTVTECLFVPLQMKEFNRSRVLMHRTALWNELRESELRQGFGAAQRLASNDYAVETKSHEPVDLITGEIEIEFQIRRPDDKEDEAFAEWAWRWADRYYWWFNPRQIWKRYLERAENKDEQFQQQIVPQLLEELVNRLRVEVVAGNRWRLDKTLLSVRGNKMLIGLRTPAAWPDLTRREFQEVLISLQADTPTGVARLLPPNSKLIVRGFHLTHRYKGERQMRFTCGEDVRGELYENIAATFDEASDDGEPLGKAESHTIEVGARVSNGENLNRRTADEKKERLLLDHLNENVEKYHRSIWMQMDPARRYILLDRYAAPHTGGLSIAQVVDNRVLGIVGNSIVLPLAPGMRIDPRFKTDDTERTLDDLYTPDFDFTSLRFTTPTKGVFAEAVMGHCNSCEKKDDTRFWRWEESPCPDDPTPILPLDTGTRNSEMDGLEPTALPQPIINIQNAPAAPDPTGLGGVVSAMTQPFADLTGSAGTQSAASQALQNAMQSSQSAALAGAQLLPQKWAHEQLSNNLSEARRAFEAGGLSAEKFQEVTGELFNAILPKSGSTSDGEVPGNVFDLAEIPGALEYSNAATGVSLKKTTEDQAKTPDDDATDTALILSVPAALLEGVKKVVLRGTDGSTQRTAPGAAIQLPNGRVGFELDITSSATYTLHFVLDDGTEQLVFEDVAGRELRGDGGFNPITTLTTEIKDALAALGGLALAAIGGGDE